MSDGTGLKARLHAGGTIVTTRIPMASTREEVQAIIRETGCEMLYVDAQHGPHTEWDIVRICKAAEELGVPVQLRIKHTRQAYLVGNLCDLGVFCIKVPEVETEAEIDEAIASFYYPPVGRRSWGGWVGYGIATRKDRVGYASWWNENGILGFKVESIRAVLNIRALCKPGIDYVDFGPADLSFDLETRQHPHLKTVEDCRVFVEKELQGTGVRVL